MFYADLRQAGYALLRHHDRTFDVQHRLVSFATRPGGPDQGDGSGWDAYGQIQGVRPNWGDEETHGDVVNWGMWPLAGVAPTGASGNARKIPGWAQAWAATAKTVSVPNDAGNGTTSGPAPTASCEVLPVLSEDWDGDDRFALRTVPLPPLVEAVPQGVGGVVVHGTEEYSQENLFVPALPNVLIAPHWNGRAAVGTTVYDLLAGDRVDRVRKAKLQTLTRVFETSPNPIFGPNAKGGHALAIHLGQARGGVWSRGAFAEDKTDPLPVEVIGFGARAAGGALEVGLPGDKHAFPGSTDREHLNSLHVSTNAYFFRDTTYDAPLEFAGDYEEAGSAGDWWRTLIRYDGASLHAHPLGMRSGLWRLETRVPVYYPDDRRRSRPGEEETWKAPEADPGLSVPAREDTVTTPDSDPGITDPATESTVTTAFASEATIVDGGHGATIPGEPVDGGVVEIPPLIPAPLAPVDGGVPELPVEDDEGFLDGPPLSPAVNLGTGEQAHPEVPVEILPPQLVPAALYLEQSLVTPRDAFQVTPLATLNEVQLPGLSFRPTSRSLAGTDYRYDRSWDRADAAAVDGVVPVVARLEAIGSEAVDGSWSYFGGQNADRYGHTGPGGLWVLPATVDSVGLHDGTVGTNASQVPSTTFGLHLVKLGFGTPADNGGTKSGFDVRFADNALVVDTKDGAGDTTSTGQLWPPAGSGTPTVGTPKGYLYGFRMAYDSGSPSQVTVGDGIARDATNSYDIAVGDPSVDYLTNGGPLKNDALLVADHGITGTATTGTEGASGFGFTFGVGNLSADVRPYLNGRTLTGTVAVAATSPSTSGIQTITGTGTAFLSEVTIGDLIGNSTCGYGAVVELTSDTVCRIIKEFSDLSSATYSGQTFTCYEQPSLQLGSTPSCKLSEISKSGANVYSRNLFNNSVNAAGLNLVIGQPAARIEWSWPVVVMPTWIYLWGRTKSDGTATLSWSTQRTTPYTPSTLSGYSYLRNLGALPIAADNFTPEFVQSRTRIVSPQTGGAKLYNSGAVLSGGSATSWTRLSLHHWAPATARRVTLGLRVIAGAADVILFVRTPGTTIESILCATKANGYGACQVTLDTDAAQGIEYKLTTATATPGFIDFVAYHGDEDRAT